MKFFNRSKQVDGWRAICFQGGEVRVAHIRRATLAKPAVTMVGAERINGGPPEAALARLAKSWGEYEYACTTAVNSGSYEFLPVDAPNVPAAELKSAISFIVKDMIDYSESDATIDVLAVPHDKNSSQRSRAMYAVAIRSSHTAEIQKWFEVAKLSLRVIDIPEMAQRNIATLLESDGRIVTMISFDENGGLLTFSGGGELFLARRIPITLTQLADADAEKRHACHERIALEIQRSLDHFGRQFNWVAVAKVVLAPLADDDGGLMQFLSENLDAKVEALDLGTIFDISAAPALKTAGNQQRYFLPLGLALRLEEKVL